MYNDMVRDVSVPELRPDPSMPKFDNPPVEEVAIGAHFKDLEGFTVVRAAELAQRWSFDYPEVEQWAPMPPLQDELDPVQPLRPSFQVDTSGRMPTPRLWFVSSDSTLVRQVQRDRVVQNWRRLKAEHEYPHYDTLRPRFIQAFTDVEDLARRGLNESVRVTQCEVSYTNPLRPGGPFTKIGDLSQVVAGWSGRFSDGFLPEPEMVTTAAHFGIRGADAELVGRLHVTVEPAIHAPTGAQVLLLQLVARGRPVGEGLDGAIRFLDLGHEWIVKGFRSFTTEQMQKEWGIRA